MQKSKKKLNENAVGVDAHIDPLKQKGITLIALIITIIVMMILVGVTVATAINGGLFETARKAARDTQIEADKEALLGAVLEALDTKTGTLDVDSITNLPEGWSNNGDGTYTSPDGNTFKVGETGKVELDEESTNPNPGGGTEPTPQPPEEDIVIKTLTPFIGESAMSLLGNYDETKKCYRVNSLDERLKDIEHVEVYVGVACSVIHDPNTNKDYIFGIDSNSNFAKVILQPEEKTKTIREGIVALSNLEEFEQEYMNDNCLFFEGLDPVGDPYDPGTGGPKHYFQGFENDEVNAIILSNIQYFNSLDSNMSLSVIDGIDYIYVPVGFSKKILQKNSANYVEFNFASDGDDVSSLNKIEIDGQEYYELHWSEL